MIAWTAAQPGVTHVLAGGRNIAQVTENAKAGDLKLEPADLARIRKDVLALGRAGEGCSEAGASYDQAHDGTSAGIAVDQPSVRALPSDLLPRRAPLEPGLSRHRKRQFGVQPAVRRPGLPSTAKSPVPVRART